MPRWRHRVPAGHTAPSGPGERDIPNQVSIVPHGGEFQPVRAWVSLTSACYQWRDQNMARKNEHKI